jgi:beta-mannanase
LNGAQTWTDWQDPWIVNAPGTEYTSWVAQAPATRQLVLQVDLIPVSLKNISNPLGWEQSCAAGAFDSYSTQLGKNLVAAGLQNSVIRLGPEMNGGWENDSMGNTTQEQNLWATCFANEVTGLRQAPGEHFLIDWNPNACTQSVPFSNFYPGNAYVDIVGLDFYDMGCDAPTTDLTFAQLSNENYGLTSFEAFAAAQGKPMSFPEWGLATGPNGDDPAYINGIGATVANHNFSFEAYFDVDAGIGLALGPGTPLSLVAFRNSFGTP